MPLATQTNLNLEPLTKYFARLFTKSAGKISPQSHDTRANRSTSGYRLVTDGGLQVADSDDAPSLAELRARPSSTPAEDRDYCPVCETPKVFRKTGPANRRPNPEPWRCSEGHHFETPASYSDLDEEPHGVGQ